MADLVVDLGPRHAGLHRHRQVLGVDGEHAVHARQVDADAALHGQQVAFERRADAERNHGHGVLVGELDHGGDVFGALAEDDRLGRRRVDGRLVAAVLLADDERGRAALTEGGLQGIEHRGRNGARREARQQMGGQGCVHGESPRRRAPVRAL